MEIEFADVRTSPLRPKGTVHRTGKIGFNSDASEFMDLDGSERFCVAFDKTDGPRGDLFLFPPTSEVPQHSCIDVAKAGDYFHLNLRKFFDRFSIEYDQYKIIYDIEEIDPAEVLGDDIGDDIEGRAYRLRRREDVKIRD